MRLVMIGNCQIQVLSGLYTRYAEGGLGHTITYIKSYQNLNHTQLRAIETADLIVEQLLEFKPKAGVEDIPTKAARIAVPVVNCGFLWPFAGQVHPINRQRPFREGGPYGAEMSDAFLNRLVKAGASPEEAYRKYLALNVTTTVNLDRLLEISLEKQAARDAKTGFSLAPLIEAFFRSEPVFLTPYHPNVRVAVALAAQFFEKLGVPAADTQRMQRAIRATPFPKEELPVHPAVARHFGLGWAPEDRTYRFLHEGRFTFAEFVHRYMACAWNEALDEGIDALAHGRHAQALPLISAGLLQSPRSAQGHASLASAVERDGRWQEAIPLLRRAIELDPLEASFHLQLAMLLQQAGETEASEREMRLAAALDPFWPHYPLTLGNRLARDGNLEEAAAVLRHGLVWSPYAAGLHVELGQTLRKAGDLAGALQSLRRAVEIDPRNAGPKAECARLLEQQGQHAEAACLLREAVALRPGDLGLNIRLAELLEKTAPDEAASAWQQITAGQLESAEQHEQVVRALLAAGRLSDALAAARRGIDVFPRFSGLRRERAIVMERLGQLDEALEEMAAASSASPADAVLIGRHADLLLRANRVAEAEARYRESLALHPGQPHVLSQLAHVLGLRQAHEEAVETLREACRLEPMNDHRRVLLGRALVMAGDLDAAEREIRAAIGRSPLVGQFHLSLSHVFERLGRLDEALQAAGQALALQPDSTQFQVRRADLLDRCNQPEAAERAYREALAQAPGNAHAQNMFSRMLARRGTAGSAGAVAGAGNGATVAA